MPLDAHACAVGERLGDRTVLTTLRSAVPYSLRQTADGLRLAASAFGPLGGDRTRLDLTVGAGATLDVGSVAAQVAQPGAHDPVSRAEVRLNVCAEASLLWHPQPLLVTAGAEHHVDLDLSVSPGGRAAIVETVVLGRSGEQSGTSRTRWRARIDGAPLLACDVELGPGASAGWDGPAGTGGARVVWSALLVGAGVLPPMPGAEVMPLSGPGCFVSALLDDPVQAAALTAHLVSAWASRPASEDRVQRWPIGAEPDGPRDRP